MSNRRYALELPDREEIRSNARLLNISSARYGGDWHSIPHAHSYAELFYIVGGDGQFRIEDKLYPVKANQLVIVTPNVIHTEVSYEAHPLEYIVLGIEGLTLAANREQDSRYRILDYRGGGDVLTCLRHILQETQSAQPGYEAICQAYMEILILRLMRSTSFAVTGASPKVSHQCATIRHYIDTHYKENLTLDLLADYAHVNKYYLAHAFKEEYGLSPINYLISRRIEESKYLLRETDMSLSQIARILGFSSPSYFSQSFRRVEGMAPMEYRKRREG
ncbi:MAG: helix-turn-helix transcriptional regulator [Oscillospiraceae bacterium]|nr:helix-turn-helix transcriptional regulator [Oscillospiraceae bacterium]MBR6596212.1 helix-turn-helix transcriptional regulator [Oscillospiraceae bacterium]